MFRFNPLHNDLDAYALAYGIASLLNNLFGRGKEPFWQQAYTNTRSARPKSTIPNSTRTAATEFPCLPSVKYWNKGKVCALNFPVSINPGSRV